MPYRHLPNTDAGITKAIDAAHKRWNDLASTPEKRLITPAHFAELNPANPAAFRTRWYKEGGEAKNALSAQVALTTASDAAFASLVQNINHFFIVFDLAIERHLMNPNSTPIFTPADRVLFERPATATTIPVITNSADALLWAERIKSGEAARASAAGSSFTPMSLPSASDIENFANAYLTILGSQDEAQSKTAAEARDVSALRPEGDALVRSMWNTIEFNLSEQGLTPEALRAQARLWGVVYIARPGEPEEPATPPAPTP
jgi:hypothetical protein